MPPLLPFPSRPFSSSGTPLGLPRPRPSGGPCPHLPLSVCMRLLEAQHFGDANVSASMCLQYLSAYCAAHIRWSASPVWSHTLHSRMVHGEPVVNVLGVAAMCRLVGSCALGSRWIANPMLSHMLRSQMAHARASLCNGRCCIARAGRAPLATLDGRVGLPSYAHWTPATHANGLSSLSVLAQKHVYLDRPSSTPATRTPESVVCKTYSSSTVRIRKANHRREHQLDRTLHGTSTLRTRKANNPRRN